jgi:aryl-alcohol dehydrogenase-like predicted oxidoreductase
MSGALGLVLLPAAAALNMGTLCSLGLAVLLPAAAALNLGTLSIPKMGMGTLNWPLDKKTDDNAAAALKACVAGGVNFFDTAEAYGFGRSEELLADCAAKSGSSVTLATKFAPVPWRQKPSDVVDAARASAARLGVQSIDLYQIHFPDIIQPFAPLGFQRRKDEEYWDGIAQCYEMGLIRNVCKVPTCAASGTRRNRRRPSIHTRAPLLSPYPPLSTPLRRRWASLTTALSC